MDVEPLSPRGLGMSPLFQCPPRAVSGYHDYEDNSQDSDLEESHRNGKKFSKQPKNEQKIKFP